MTPEALAALHARCFTVPRPWRAAEFRSLLATAGAFLVSRPQGFALGRVAGGEAELCTLAVVPEARRGGTGRGMVAETAERAGNSGASVLFLEVAADNTAALALYASCGFAEAGRRRGYYRGAAGHSVDALVLRRSLAPA